MAEFDRESILRGMTEEQFSEKVTLELTREELCEVRSALDEWRHLAQAVWPGDVPDEERARVLRILRALDARTAPLVLREPASGSWDVPGE